MNLTLQLKPTWTLPHNEWINKYKSWRLIIPKAAQWWKWALWYVFMQQGVPASFPLMTFSLRKTPLWRRLSLSLLPPLFSLSLPSRSSTETVRLQSQEIKQLFNLQPPGTYQSNKALSSSSLARRSRPKIYRMAVSEPGPVFDIKHHSVDKYDNTSWNTAVIMSWHFSYMYFHSGKPHYESVTFGWWASGQKKTNVNIIANLCLHLLWSATKQMYMLVLREHFGIFKCQ